MVIEPDATVKIVTSGDHIHADSLFSCWGLSFPQSSVDASLLNDACMRITGSCKQRNIVGHFDIDFVTYIDAKTVSLRLRYMVNFINFSNKTLNVNRRNKFSGQLI